MRQETSDWSGPSLPPRRCHVDVAIVIVRARSFSRGCRPMIYSTITYRIFYTSVLCEWIDFTVLSLKKSFLIPLSRPLEHMCIPTTQHLVPNVCGLTPAFHERTPVISHFISVSKIYGFGGSAVPGFRVSHGSVIHASVKFRAFAPGSSVRY
jgi:hypothetical protein